MSRLGPYNPNTIVVGDCLEVMRQMPDGCADLVITDPPYGKKSSRGTHGFGCARNRRYDDDWDNQIPGSEVFDEILRVSKQQIIFGGNYFAHLLPPSNGWIVWDKKGSIRFQNPFADCELLWTSFPGPIKKYVFIQQGFITDSKDERLHPTQKPTELVCKIVESFSGQGDLIFDPFMGSGTTAVAADRLGRNFFGCDTNPDYVKMSLDRIRQDRLKRSQLTLL